MTWVPTREYLIAVQKGEIAGEAMVHKFGWNNAVPNGSWEFVDNIGFTGWPLSAPDNVRVKAGGDAADGVGGAGVRVITVQGVGDNLALLEEDITLAGIAASAATVGSFWRVHRMFGKTNGTYGGSNTDDIVLESDDGSPVDLLKIEAGEGQSEFCGYSIPTGKTAYLIAVHFNVESNKTARLRLRTRQAFNDTSAPMSPARDRLLFEGVIGAYSYISQGPDFMLPGVSDIWVEAWGVGGTASVSAQMEFLLVDD